MTGIKLEVGKRYVRRDGSISSPVSADPHPSKNYKFVTLEGSDNPWFYREDGRLFSEWEDPLDLVSEHVEPAPEAGVVGVPTVYAMVPIAALKWLHGEGPDDDGIWFGDAERVTGSGSYWWRTVFRRMCAASPPPPSDPVVQKLVEALKGMVGGKCPSCAGWGEVAYMGDMVSCECNSKYRYFPTDEQITAARAALALVGEVG